MASGRALALGDFLGLWRFERQVLEPSGHPSASVSGQAEIAMTGEETALYHEDGTMRLPGQAPMTATRRYLWQAAPGGIAVSFDDGRAFHLITLGGTGASASHWCDPDQYDVAYDFSAWPVWTSDWRVKGPRKDYRMVTRYARA